MNREQRQLIREAKYAAKIIQQFSLETIDAKRRELCDTCHFKKSNVCGLNPLLIPITSKGENCPYHLLQTPADNPTK